MTNEKNSVIMTPANPVKTVAPEKEETEMLNCLTSPGLKIVPEHPEAIESEEAWIAAGGGQLPA